MAEGKKSFVLYADLLSTVDKMPDDKAGELLKHILKYVNDLNPETDDLLVQIAFEPIKNQLKRDLKKWEDLKVKRSEAGKRSAEARAKRAEQKETNSTSVKSVEQSSTNSTVNDTVNVTVNVNDTVNDNTKYYYEKDNLKLTEEEKEKICQKYDILILDEYISRVENWKNKHKVKSLYLTVLNWIRKDEKQNQSLNANQQTQSPDGVQQWKPIRDATF